MKSCNNTKCIQTNPQPLEAFSKNKSCKDGLQSRCKTCNSIDTKAFEKANPDKKKERDRVYRKNNKEKRRAYNIEWEKNNPEYRKTYEAEWNKNNPEKLKAKDAKWAKANPAKRAAKQMRRQAKKLKATPSWLTEEHHGQILEFYELAQELQWLSEEPLQVDHIIPLQGENVSGLHVPWNLQILPKSMNISKGNRF
jgi:hypothetical protein